MSRIVIVDDSRLARTFAAACLRKGGHEVQEVEPTSLFDVLKVLQAQPPDLLLMDCHMPNCPGVHLARACAEDEALRDMKVMVLTAHHDEDVTTQFMKLGVAWVMFKPFEPKALLELISDIVG